MEKKGLEGFSNYICLDDSCLDKDVCYSIECMSRGPIEKLGIAHLGFSKAFLFFVFVFLFSISMFFNIEKMRFEFEIMSRFWC